NGEWRHAKRDERRSTSHKIIPRLKVLHGTCALLAKNNGNRRTPPRQKQSSRNYRATLRPECQRGSTGSALSQKSPATTIQKTSCHRQNDATNSSIMRKHLPRILSHGFSENGPTRLPQAPIPQPEE